MNVSCGIYFSCFLFYCRRAKVLKWNKIHLARTVYLILSYLILFHVRGADGVMGRLCCIFGNKWWRERSGNAASYRRSFRSKTRRAAAKYAWWSVKSRSFLYIARSKVVINTHNHKPVDCSPSAPILAHSARLWMLQWFSRSSRRRCRVITAAAERDDGDATSRTEWRLKPMHSHCRADGVTRHVCCDEPTVSRTRRFHTGAGGGHRPLRIVARPPNLAGSQIVARQPKLSRTLDTLWSIDSQKN